MEICKAFNVKNQSFAVGIEQNLPLWGNIATDGSNFFQFTQGKSENSTNIVFDLIVIGGGFSGVSAANEAAILKKSVLLLEANKIGSGASGKNGGLVCTGYRKDQEWLEKTLGVEKAIDMWNIYRQAYLNLQEYSSKNKIDFETGIAYAAHNNENLEHIISEYEYLKDNYHFEEYEVLDAKQTAKILGTNKYKGAIKDNRAGRLHPLKYLYSLAKDAVNNGVIISENTKVIKFIEHTNFIEVFTRLGVYKTKKLLICGDGYLNNLNQKLESQIIPIHSFVLATEPLKQDVMDGIFGAMDTKFIVNYWQKTSDNRLIYGGGEKYTQNYPEDLKGFVRKNLLKIYPQLENVKIDYAWGGALGLSLNRLPVVKQISPNIIGLGGYSGQGVLLAPHIGKLAADYLLNLPAPTHPLNCLLKIKHNNFIGGKLLRQPLLTMGMTYYALKDKF